MAEKDMDIPDTDPPADLEADDAVAVDDLDDVLDGAASMDERPDARDWSQVWQVPTLLAGLLLLSIGVWTSLPEPDEQDFGAHMDSVEQYFAARNFPKAEEELDVIGLNLEFATEAEKARYAALRGDLIHFQQEANEWDLPENYEKIISLYGQARELGYPLEPDRHLRWAHALIALHRDGEALALTERMTDAPPSYRYGVLKELIEQRRHEVDMSAEAIKALLVRFEEAIREETVADKRRAELIWLADVTAQLMIDEGLPQEAIDYLTPRMLRLTDTGGEKGLEPLWIDLARAYSGIGRDDEAATWFDRAQKNLDESDPLNADVLVGLARIALSQEGDTAKAMGLFSRAATLYQSTPAYLDALVGRADCEARLGSHGDAIEHFGQAVQITLGRLRREPDRAEWLTGVVRSHYDLNMDKDAFERALDYLTVLTPLYGGPSDLPPQVLLDFAITHEKIADAQAAEARQLGEEAEAALAAANPSQPASIDDEQTAADREKARRIANKAAAEHHRFAGEYYRAHARAVTISDDDMHGQSLWNAAEHFDKAQLWEEAIEVYSDFVASRPADPRHLQAQNLLGRAYLAEGQYEVAAKQFKSLIEDHPQAAPANNSLVPLARAYVELDEPDMALRVLESVVANHPVIRPESPIYRDALIELGRLHYNSGQFEEAIPHLQMAVDRYADAEEGPALKFRLADSYRQSIAALDETLKQPQPQSKTLALNQERRKRLNTARDLYGEAIADFTARPIDALTEVEKLYLRNAYFYRGDCAFDLGDYEQAITFYDQAAKRYEQHPASLVALVQIVSCHCELGQFQAARVANDRARWQLRRIPDEAFDDPSLPMSRQHWEDWLKWTAELNLFEKQAAAGE